MAGARSAVVAADVEAPDDGAVREGQGEQNRDLADDGSPVAGERVARTGLRSLFGWAKTHKVIFRNPTTRPAKIKKKDDLWQPLLPEQIRQAAQIATSPAARLILVLAAVHAARPGQIRALHLHDIDLTTRRLTVTGHDRPLDELTHASLLTWLDHRENWPHTANPHLLISQRTTVGLGPVSHPWLTRTLKGLPVTLEQLRIDRQLEEALTSGADPLHLASVFALSPSTAIRYATNAAQLLPGPDRTGHLGWPRTPASETDTQHIQP